MHDAVLTQDPGGPDAGDDRAAYAIVRRTGWIVLALGVLEIVFGILGAPAGNVRITLTGLVVGALVMLGGALRSLRLLSVLRWLALLVLGLRSFDLVSSFVVMPAGLALAQLRLAPGAFATAWLGWLLGTAIAAVVALSLGHPGLLAARARAGRRLRNPRIPLALGLVLSVAACIVEYRVLHGETAQRAVQMAQQQLGPGYRSFPNAINTSFGKGKTRVATCTVQAWNDKELRAVNVRWEE